MNLKLEQLKNRCIKEKIPLVREKTIKLISQTINDHQFKSYLEIGTAFGYSSLYVALNTNLELIQTIEKDAYRFSVANEYLKEHNYIKQFHADCLVWNTTKKFDFIFVDGPKSQQINIVNQYLNYLNDDGIMFVDNLDLKNIRDLENKTKNQIKILKKLDDFKTFLINNPQINVDFLDIDDGVAIIKKVKLE